MKKQYSTHRLAILSIIFFAFSLIGWGCGGDENGNHAAEPHAGHNHGPGEHVDSIQESNDPQAGHDHGPVEHGEVAADNLGWCIEHAVPESSCTHCHPELSKQFKASGDWCISHDLPESHCRLCNPDIRFPQEITLRERSFSSDEQDLEVSLWFRPNSQVCATNGALIQFTSAATIEKTGLTVEAVLSASLEDIVEAPAEVIFDESRCNVVTSTVPALVSRWLVVPGDQVQRGDTMAILSSPEIAELKSRMLSAHADHTLQQKEVARHQTLQSASLISDSDYERQEALGEKALAEYIAARGLLNAAGLNEADIDAIIDQHQVTNGFALRAPADGIVAKRTAQLGELLDAGGAFAFLANPSSMWIEARLAEENLRHVKVGQSMFFSSDGRGMDRVGATVIWVSSFLDPHSRTGTVRAQVADPHHKLRAGEFGRASIVRRSPQTVFLLPKDAVQWEGCCNVVFIRETGLRYRPRKVELLGSTGPYYQVDGEIVPGDEVVVDGAFLLKTELKKASLGTGCCGLEPTGQG